MGKTYIVIAHSGKHSDSTQKVIYAGGDFIIATAQTVTAEYHTLNLETWLSGKLVQEHERTANNGWFETYNKVEELERSIQLKREELEKEEHLLKALKVE